ncbi:(d)CMP kinase [Actinotignum sp. GS-2025b]|uniref:(d)CMP kinase n=1 Tax=unclassified Actinotignum TaxID=2632702 RepID=UPI003F452C0B
MSEMNTAGTQGPEAAGTPHAEAMDTPCLKTSGYPIAIDGPSGSGKSTVSRQVARELGLSYLDTGAMYRAAAWAAQHAGVELTDQPAVTAVVRAMNLDMPLDPDNQKISCEGEDITAAIRAPELSRVVSQVAVNLEVRAELIARQRAIIAAHPRIVVEGRDITSVVAPEAPTKILLTASEETRLARRAREVRGSAAPDALAATRAEVTERDAKDSTVASFLEDRAGVVTIDSSQMSIADVVAAVRTLAQGFGKEQE